MGIGELAVTTNGTAPAGELPVATPGPRMPKRLRWIDLPSVDNSGEEAYPGFRVKLWVNYPAALLNEIRSGEHPRVKAALQKIVLEHNGWCDDEGTPFPPTDAEDFWEVVPTELAAIVISYIQTETVKLPNSMLQERQR